MLNIFHNFIPNENIICNDKDPPWFNNQIKTLIEKKSISLKAIWLMVDWPWICQVVKGRCKTNKHN